MLCDVVIYASISTTVEVHESYRSVIATAIDILFNRTTRDIDKSISRYASCPYHWGECIVHSRNRGIATGNNNGRVLFITTISTAKDITMNNRIVGREYIDSSTVTYDTILTTAIDTVHDFTTAYVHLCKFNYSHLRP